MSQLPSVFETSLTVVCIGGEVSTSAIRQTLGTSYCNTRIGVPQSYESTIAAMQAVASEINKMKRASFRQFLVLCRVYLFHRRPVAKGCEKLDFPSGPVQKSRLGTPDPLWRICCVVHPRPHFQGLGSCRGSSLDTRQTCVFLVAPSSATNGRLWL